MSEFEKWIKNFDETWVDMSIDEAIPLALESSWNAATKAAKRWIPVSERLPLESGWYPVISTMQMSKRKWSQDYFDLFRGFSIDVTHWLELPELPE